MRPMLKDALAIDELNYDLTEIIAVDDRCEVEDITDDTIMIEAKYVLEKFTSSVQGFFHHDALMGRDGAEEQAWARKNVKQLKAFIRKYNKPVTTLDVTKYEAKAGDEDSFSNLD